MHWKNVPKLSSLVPAFCSHLSSAAFIPATTLLPQRQLVTHTLAASQARPEITGPPLLEPRDEPINSICGYWSDKASTYTIDCASNVPCTFVDIDTTKAAGYCSSFDGEPPVTAAFDYNGWPAGGCTDGQLCCSSTLPWIGIYLLNNRSSGVFRCDTTPFTRTASTAPAKPSSVSATSTARSTATSSTTGNTSQPTETPTSSSSSGSGRLSVGSIVALVAGCVVILGGVFGFLRWFRRPKIDSDALDRGNAALVELKKRKNFNNGQIIGPNDFHFHEPVILSNCRFGGEIVDGHLARGSRLTIGAGSSKKMLEKSSVLLLK